MFLIVILQNRNECVHHICNMFIYFSFFCKVFYVRQEAFLKNEFLIFSFKFFIWGCVIQIIGYSSSLFYKTWMNVYIIFLICLSIYSFYCKVFYVKQEAFLENAFPMIHCWILRQNILSLYEYFKHWFPRKP